MTQEQYNKFVQWANFVKDVPPDEFHIGAYKTNMTGRETHCALGLLPILFYDEFENVDKDTVNYFDWADNFFGANLSLRFAEYNNYDVSLYPARYNYPRYDLNEKPDPSPMDVYEKMMEVLGKYVAGHPQA